MTTTWKDLITLDNFYWIDKKEERPREEAGVHARPGVPLPQLMNQIEAQIIRNALRRTGGNKKAAAAELGISRQMLHRKIRQFQIE